MVFFFWSARWCGLFSSVCPFFSISVPLQFRRSYKRPLYVIMLPYAQTDHLFRISANAHYHRDRLGPGGDDHRRDKYGDIRARGPRIGS